MGVGAVLDQEDPFGAAELGDAIAVEGDVAADVDEHRRPGPVLVHRTLEIGEGHAQVFAVAVDERDAPAGVQHGQRGGHEGVGRHEHRLPGHARELERGEGGPGPAGEDDGAQAVPGAPRRLEAPGHVPLRPLLRSDDLVPQLVQPGAVAQVEADREGGVVEGRGGHGGPGIYGMVNVDR